MKRTCTSSCPTARTTASSSTRADKVSGKDETLTVWTLYTHDR